MPNNDFPHGLRLVGRSIHGGEIEVAHLTKAVGDSAAIFQGDCVAMATNGVITATRTPGTTLIAGVALNFGAADTETEHVVSTGPSVVYEGQDDEDVNGIQADELHMKTNITATTGDLATQLSKQEVDADVNTTGTLDAQLLGLYKAANNEIGAGIGHVRVELLINKSYYNPGATALGT